MSELTYTGVLLDPENHRTERVELPEENFHSTAEKLIRCCAVDMVTSVSADFIRYVVVFDDIGRLKGRPPSIFCGIPYIMGPAIILGFDGENDVRSLCETEIYRFGCPDGDGTADMMQYTFFDRGLRTPEDAEVYLTEYLEEC